MSTVTFQFEGDAPLEVPLREFDAEQYIAMAEAGVFDPPVGEPRCRVDLFEGVVITMSPSGSDHNFIVMRFTDLFAGFVSKFMLSVQGTLRVDRRHVLDPDFMLLKPRELSYRRALPAPTDVALLVEVADSSLRNDEQIKRPVYASAGIPDFWLVDVGAEKIVVYRQPQGNTFADVQTYAGDDQIAPLATPGFKVRVADLFA